MTFSQWNKGYGVLAARSGWMTWYDRDREPAGPVRGGAWNEDEMGSEVNNFAVRRGMCRGYVKTGPSGLNLARLNLPERDSAERLLVLFFAPAAGGGQVLVGWYKNARGLPEYLDQRLIRRRDAGLVFNLEARTKDCVLLPTDRRTREAPHRGPGCFGQAMLRYGLDAKGRPALTRWMKEAVKFALSYRGPNLLTDPGAEPLEAVLGSGTFGRRQKERANFAATPNRDELEKRALDALLAGEVDPPKGNAKPKRSRVATYAYARDPRVHAHVLLRALGHCEVCSEPAPFMNDSGAPFLEVHHLRTLAEGGPDKPANAIAACPNCHRRLHLAQDRKDRIAALYRRHSFLKR